jgi:hypothetical protein
VKIPDEDLAGPAHRRRALLTGIDIPSHMTAYRTDHIDRYERVRTAGDIDALFVEPEGEAPEGDA